MPTTLLLRDWEELPDGLDEAWEELVAKLLNGVGGCAGRGLVGAGTFIHEKSRGIVPISEVRVGDIVQDWKEKPWTRVIGIYEDNSESQPGSGPNAAAWVFNGKWRHPSYSDTGIRGKKGYHLVTESGTFVLSTGEWMRDFTEVGADRIAETYDFVLSQLQVR
jgi:hypothetical protein